MSQAKPRRRRRLRQSSPAEKLRQLEVREPVFTVFAKRLGRRTVQHYMFGSHPGNTVALHRAENEAAHERTKAAVIMPGVAPPVRVVAWEAIVEPWKARSERRVRQVVQWQDGHMVSRLDAT